MQRTPLQSSAVAAAGYDVATQTLEIEFVSGRVYRYDGVPEGVYAWLLRTPSKGSYVSRMINGSYPYRDVTANAASSEPEASDIEALLRASLRQNAERDR
jgi:hypothetical protein